MASRIGLGALAVTLVLSLSGCSAVSDGLAQLRDRLPGSGLGGPAADFAFDSFGGGPVQLADLRGKPVVLNFWASWCVPCRAEMPAFERIYRQYRDQGVAFVGLAVEDDPQSARSFVESLAITYPTGMDKRNAAATGYKVVGLPTTVLISADGQLVNRWNGPVSEEELADATRRLVAGGSRPA